MSRFVVTWELGGGLGHIARLRPITAGLADRGHDVIVVSRNVPLCHHHLARPGVTILPAPVLPISRRRVRMPCTFADVLHDCGFAELSNLEAVVWSWRHLFNLLRPDVLLADHSPAALLASRGMEFTKAVLGTGFLCPPDVTPLPSLRSRRPDPPWIADVELLVLRNMNAALLSLDAAPFSHVAELYASVDRQYLLTLAELDHYPNRLHARYWRPISAIGGESPHWPIDSRPKLFLYLKAHPTTLAILRALAKRELSTVCCWIDAPRDVRAEFDNTTIYLDAQPVDIHLACQQSDLAVLNGGHGATCEFLLAGKPLLILPQSLEQQVTGERVAQYGMGLMGSLRRPDQVLPAIDRLLGEPSFRTSAERISGKYVEEDPLHAISRLLDDIETMCADGGLRRES
jgi:hypothetical protein